MSTEKAKLYAGLTIKEIFAISFLVIIYFVGIFGIGKNLVPGMVNLTPANLILSMLIISLFHQGNKRPFLIFLSVCFGVGFGLEILGIQTGLIFGGYAYGNVLGPKILGTPPLIGLNWALLVYSIGSSINLFFSRWKMFFKVLYASLLLVALDFLIEPVAIEMVFWSWDQVEVPMQNYIAWGLIGAGLFYYFFRRFPTESNKVAYALFILQCVFFGLLNFLLNT